MATLDELIAQRDKLEQARNSGKRRVRIGQSEIEYKTDSEMASALAALNSQIRALQGKKRFGFTYVSCSKGL